eukprot:3689459-Alexandrium_andersonii.AAC.1
MLRLAQGNRGGDTHTSAPALRSASLEQGWPPSGALQRYECARCIRSMSNPYFFEKRAEASCKG